jgi:ABC-type bacteriocin/lantibiotic exporter with double-glycine peptidase domain
VIFVFAKVVATIIVVMIKGWKVALVTFASIPIIAIAGAIYVTAVQTKDKRNTKYYTKAGGLASQTLLSIKTVKQLNGEDF